VEFIGTIPYDDKVTEAQMERLSVVEYGDSPSARSIKEIWEKIKH
jgi:MinD superfamily P-loop ATPase